MEREESDLYGLPLDEFVPARAELEKRLRREGERDRATAVKRLAKPTAAAWAVNQASRCRPKERRALLEASGELHDVQERLLSGDASARDLEAATAKQREAIEGLVKAAEGLLSKEGKSLTDATLARVRETFAAVATDPELAELVEAGTLDRERRATGLGFPGFGAAEAPPARGAPEDKGRKGKGKTRKGKTGKGKTGKGKAAKTAGADAKAGRADAKAGRADAKAGRADAKARAADQKRRVAARERAKAAAKEEREAQQRSDAAARAARKAAQQVEKRERQLEEARARAAEAEGALDEARAGAEAAREELDAAASARDEAARARTAAEDELD